MKKRFIEAELEDFIEMTNILETLGFKYGPDNANAWTAGDSVPVIIQDFPDNWAGPYTLGD